MRFKVAVSLLMVAWLGAYTIQALAQGGEKATKPADNAGNQVEKVDILAQAEIFLPPGTGDHPPGAVIRTAKGLAKLLNMADADKAEAVVRKALKVKGLDFEQQMLMVLVPKRRPLTDIISPIEASLQVKDNVMYVSWSYNEHQNMLKRPNAASGCLLILTNKFDGKIVFYQPGGSSR
jgi:hypothetical protein